MTLRENALCRVRQRLANEPLGATVMVRPDDVRQWKEHRVLRADRTAEVGDRPPDDPVPGGQRPAGERAARGAVRIPDGDVRAGLRPEADAEVAAVEAERLV